MMLVGMFITIPQIVSATPIEMTGSMLAQHDAISNNITMNNPTTVTSGPVIPHPNRTIVVIPVYNAYVSHNTTSSLANSSVSFSSGNFSRKTVSFFDQYSSNPFDDSFIVSVNNVQILTGNTLELENTSVAENVTHYRSIFAKNSTVFVTSHQFNVNFEYLVHIL
ncbi:MAG: hypothetical protein QXU18_14750 [Thermoplasmatales archaeon]